MDAEEFVKQFNLVLDRSRSRPQYAYLRSTINSEEEANQFVDLFAENTNTIWIPLTGKQISARYNFQLSWYCKRSWRKKSTSQGDDCNAKIDIYVRKPEPSCAKYDEYLHYDPPLPCVIEIAGHHSHPLECLNYRYIQDIKDQVKREFFKYFQNGLSVSDAKNKYVMRYRNKRSLRSKYTPTLRQAQSLYNDWKSAVKWSSMQKDKPIGSLTDRVETFTFEEMLSAMPKREILYSAKHLQSRTDIPAKSDSTSHNKEFKFPLVFISVGFEAAMPISAAPLLYKLKHDIAGEFVSDLVKPRIYSICIDSAAPVVVQGQHTEPSPGLQNSSEPVSDEILGVPMTVDEAHLPVEVVLNDIPDIQIKTEPLNDGYETAPSQSSTQKIEGTSVMPIITQAFSCNETATTEEIDIKPNICCVDSTVEETDIKPNICCDKAGNTFFPLVFTLKGSIYEAYCGRLLVYELKQGSSGVQATETAIPLISSVQINSLNEAAFQFKDASMIKAEGPLSISVQTEFLEENSKSASLNGSKNERVYEKDIIPVIVNGSSCSDLFPVIADSTTPISKRPREDLVVSPVVATSNIVVNEPAQEKRKLTNTVKQLLTMTAIDKTDEDYQFLMSLLPELKQLPLEEKNSVKSRIKDIFVTSRFTTNRIQFEKKSTNVYRNCGVLPISGGWKF